MSSRYCHVREIVLFGRETAHQKSHYVITGLNSPHVPVPGHVLLHSGSGSGQSQVVRLPSATAVSMRGLSYTNYSTVLSITVALC